MTTDSHDRRLRILIDTYGITRKLYSEIKKDLELVSWLKTKISQATSLPEQVYCFVKNESPICKHGKQRTFKDSWAGYYRCGTINCECWKENQSKKVSGSKRAMSESQRQSVLDKRKETSLKKYGTEYASQSDAVKRKISDTNHLRYGVNSTLQHANTKAKINESLIQKYGQDNPMKVPEIKEKSMETCLKKYGHVVFPHSTQGRQIVRATLRTKHNVSSISQLKFSNEVRVLLNDPDRFCKEYSKIGIQGMCEKYPELNHALCRDVLIRAGITEVVHYSKPELFIKEFLDQNNVQFMFNTRKIIPPLELDFFLPDRNLAIEVCGLYWHRDEHLRNPKYHVNKLQQCLGKGIQLLTIFSDHIDHSPDIVRSRLESKLKVLPRKIHARKLTISNDVSRTEIASFLRSTHLQGAKLGSANIVAIDGTGKIHAAMTFGGLRTSLGQTAKESVYEMYRFATSGNIPGIASRLFNQFIKDHHPNTVVSYADRCWGEGDLYIKLGFIKDSTSRPNYWYTDDFITRHHRYNFAKHKLVAAGYDRNLTEFQIMENRGYSKIYDCGTNKFVWHRSGG